MDSANVSQQMSKCGAYRVHTQTKCLWISHGSRHWQELHYIGHTSSLLSHSLANRVSHRARIALSVRTNESQYSM